MTLIPRFGARKGRSPVHIPRPSPAPRDAPATCRPACAPVSLNRPWMSAETRERLIGREDEAARRLRVGCVVGEIDVRREKR